MGVVFGCLVGVTGWFLPNKTEVNVHVQIYCTQTIKLYFVLQYIKSLFHVIFI